MLASSVTACPCWSANIHRAPSKSRRQLRPTSDGPAGRVSTVPRSYFLVRARLLWVSIRRYRSSWTRKAIVFKGSRAPRTTAGCERLEADREKAGASDLLRGPKALTGQVRCGDPTTDKLAPAAQHHFRIFSVMSRHRALVKGSKLSILLALSSLDVVRMLPNSKVQARLLWPEPAGSQDLQIDEDRAHGGEQRQGAPGRGVEKVVVGKGNYR